jgi:hypothetical protein
MELLMPAQLMFAESDVNARGSLRALAMQASINPNVADFEGRAGTLARLFQSATAVRMSIADFTFCEICGTSPERRKSLEIDGQECPSYDLLMQPQGKACQILRQEPTLITWRY